MKDSHAKGSSITPGDPGSLAPRLKHHGVWVESKIWPGRIGRISTVDSQGIHVLWEPYRPLKINWSGGCTKASELIRLRRKPKPWFRSYHEHMGTVLTSRSSITLDSDRTGDVSGPVSLVRGDLAGRFRQVLGSLDLEADPITVRRAERG